MSRLFNNFIILSFLLSNLILAQDKRPNKADLTKKLTQVKEAKVPSDQISEDYLELFNEVFSILMGDVVEPRKIFIQTHALEVKNLDV